MDSDVGLQETPVDGISFASLGHESATVSDINAYMRRASRMPMLTADEERLLAIQANQGDETAIGRMAQAYLKLVISISREYGGYKLPQADLIQEGSVGLLKAIKRFDPERGTRLSSYAMPWIRAEMDEYILRNIKMVRLGTTKVQRKLFFNLRRLKMEMRGATLKTHEPVTHEHALRTDEIALIAKTLNVTAEDVMHMELRLSGADTSFDTGLNDDDDDDGALYFLGTEQYEPTQVMQRQHREWMGSEGIAKALETLDARSRDIVYSRWLDTDDEGRGGARLEDLARKYGVSAERIRQIEVKALKAMRSSLQ